MLKSLFNIIFLLAGLAITNWSCQANGKKELVKLQFVANGCFGSEQNELTITEDKGITKARLTINDTGIYTADISREQLQRAYAFTDELKKVEVETGCTLHINIKVRTSNGTIEKEDINCEWDGYETLKGDLFEGQGIGNKVTYEEMPNNRAVVLPAFSFRNGDYDFYFDVKQVTDLCGKRIQTDKELAWMYKSIKQEVNHETGSYNVNNHSWLLSLFTPRIINYKTKEDGKSLLIRCSQYPSHNCTYHVITQIGDTVRLTNSKYGDI